MPAGDVYRAVLRRNGTGRTAGERRHLLRVHAAKRAHIVRLDAGLGAAAPLTSDFVTALPNGEVTTKARISHAPSGSRCSS